MNNKFKKSKQYVVRTGKTVRGGDAGNPLHIAFFVETYGQTS